ncbi:hypothetical protein [Gluconobacter oxydans]|uniref:Pectate lyase superfamily protein domain-containing protein n=1 Tax=Gluconobacter oxydans TaxID=442 RepID=A0A149S8E4_GLUOY|nr:hypothetical protein [Gluconobacter oxydans]KXV22999.1 hypothetical protein AD934_00750 [Gluconobacter oxydans]
MKSRFAILAVGLFGIEAAAAQAPIQTRGGGIQGQATNSTWKIGPDGIAHFSAIDPTTVIERQNLGQIMEKVNAAVASAANAITRDAIGNPLGVAGLDAGGNVTAPIAGDVSAASSQTAGAPSSRSIASHFGDSLSVKDFGAHLDGSNDDATAFQAAKSAAGNAQVIMLPPSSQPVIKLSAFPTSTAAKVNFWWLFGQRSLAGSNGFPVYQFGYDPIFSTTGNGFWMSRMKQAAGMDAPLLRVDDNLSDGPGTPGDVSAAIQGNCAVAQTRMEKYEWCGTFVLNSRSYGGSQSMGLAAHANRMADAMSDGKGPRSPIWAGYEAVDDRTGLASALSGTIVGHELDAMGTGQGDTQTVAGDGSITTANIAGRLGFQLGLQNHWDKGPTFGIGEAFTVGGVSNPLQTCASVSGSDQSPICTTSKITPGTPFVEVGYAISSPYAVAAFDAERATPLSLWHYNTKAIAVGDTSISFESIYDGMYLGQQVVSGSIFPAGTVVTAIDPSSNTITVSNPATGTLPVGGGVWLTSVAPAYKMGYGQFISFDSNNSHQLYVDGGSRNLTYKSLGQDVFSVGQGGNVTVNSSYAQGPAITVQGTSNSGVDTSALSATRALQMKTGQTVNWEASQVISTGWDGANLVDKTSSVTTRALDTAGNEMLLGTVQPHKGVVLPNMTTAQIKAMTNVASATEVYDTDTKTVVLLVDGTWHQIALGDAL